MAFSQQNINLTEVALAFARDMVETGQYADIATAVSEEMIKFSGPRDHDQTLHRAGTQLRTPAYCDTWEPVSVTDSFPASDRAR
jgi:antitoxin ParD1/3/4